SCAALRREAAWIDAYERDGSLASCAEHQRVLDVRYTLQFLLDLGRRNPLPRRRLEEIGFTTGDSQEAVGVQNPEIAGTPESVGIRSLVRVNTVAVPAKNAGAAHFDLPFQGQPDLVCREGAADRSELAHTGPVHRYRYDVLAQAIRLVNVQTNRVEELEQPDRHGCRSAH